MSTVPCFHVNISYTSVKISSVQDNADIFIKLGMGFLKGHSRLKVNIFVFLCVAAGSPGRSKSERPEERALSAEDQEAEPVSVKERLAMYQAAVSKKETSSSSSAAVRQYFPQGCNRRRLRGHAGTDSV